MFTSEKISEKNVVDINNLDFLDLMNKKWYQRKFGTKWFVAIRHALITTVAAIWIFVPHKYYAGAVVITPVFGVVIGCALSSWSIIANGATIVYASSIASLYCYLVLLIIPRDLYWIEFITTTIFIFIITSFANTRRWLTLNTVRKVLVDITTNLFFTQTFNISQKYQLLGQQVICSLFLLGCAIVVNIFIPTLASRMFTQKIERALRWIKIYYRAIGSKMIEQSINASSKSPLSESTLLDQKWITKLPLAKKNKDYKDLLKTKNESNTTVPSSPSNNRDMDYNASYIIDSINNNNNNTSTTNNTNESGGASETASLINNITDDQIAEIEIRLSEELNKLSTLYNETSQERWNAKFLPLFDQLLACLEISFKQLISLNSAISLGFNMTTNRKIIGPITPFISSIVEEVYHQNLLMIDILEFGYKRSDISKDPSDDININIPTHLDRSLTETEAHVKNAQVAYREIINEYQLNSDKSFYDSDITRAQFCINGIFTLAITQRYLVETIYRINEKKRKYPIQIEILIHGGWYFLTALPRYIYSFITYFKSSQSSTSTNNNNSNISIKSKLKKLFMDTFIDDQRWHFPLQLSVAYASCMIPMYYLDGMSKNSFVIKGAWAVISVAMVMTPSIGSTVTRFIHRLGGTILGAFAGLLLSYIDKPIGSSPGREIVLLVGTFIWILFTSFFQQNPQYIYFGIVTGFSFIIIGYAPYQNGVFNEMNAVIRTFMLVVGLVWIILTAYLVFPLFTYRHSRPKLFKISQKMVNTFLLIVSQSLRLPPITPPDDQTAATTIDIQPASSSPESTLSPWTSKQEIGESIRSIRQSIAQSKSLLLDIRSELLFRPGRDIQYRDFVGLMDSLSMLYVRLVSTESSLHKPLSESLLLCTKELEHPILTILQSIKKIDQATDQYFISKKELPLDSLIEELQINMTSFDQQMKSFSIPLISERAVYLSDQQEDTHIASEGIQFGSAIFNIQEFVHQYLIVSRHLSLIKKKILHKKINK